MEELFTLQEEFTKRFVRDKCGKEISELTEEERLLFVKDYVLHLHQELSSVLSCTSYKMHRKPMEKLIHTNIFEELIDTVKFTLGLWCILGGDVQSFRDGFQEKSEVVAWRYQQDKDVEALADREVAILDIDGVLAQYPGPMLKFMEVESGQALHELSTAKQTLGILEYERLKECYRLSGIKAKLPLTDGAKDFIDYLRARGLAVVLISSRPYERYLNILPDTINWAKRHKLEFDALYFDDEKAIKMAKRFPKAKIFIDDSSEQVKNVVAFSQSQSDSEIAHIFFLDPTGKNAIPGAETVQSLQDVIARLKQEDQP